MKLSERISRDLRIDAVYIESLACKNNLYKRYYIPKKNGGKRLILQPSKKLKVLQRWLVRKILAEYPISKYSTAYSKGDSPRKNAAAHRKSNYILHTDIKNFFPSITRAMLLEYFKDNRNISNKLGLDQEDIKLILDICLYRGKTLVVGSVASPRLANMVMYKFDNELSEALRPHDIKTYTRYADDIVVSSNKYIENDVINEIEKIIEKYGFEINNDKSHYMNKKGRRQITGVVIDNNNNCLTIGNKKYKRIERQIYNYLVKNEGNLGYITGYLSHVRSINEEQYNQLAKIYKRYDANNKLF